MRERSLTVRLAATALVMALGLAAILATRSWQPRPEFDRMLDAANRAQRAFQAVKEEKQRRGLPIPALDDLNETGLIGDSFTTITTT